MASKYHTILNAYQAEIAGFAEDENEWKHFLRTAALNYKYTFTEQVCIFLQDPGVSACAELKFWNARFDRWVNKGAKGIALLDNNAGSAKLRYVFDVSNTHSRDGSEIRLWSVEETDHNEIIDGLEDSFGDLEDRTSFAQAIKSAASNLVEDNYQDYYSDVISFKQGTFLENVENEKTEEMLKDIMKSSVTYMMLLRAGLEPEEYIGTADFKAIYFFNSQDVMTAFGESVSDIAEMGIREIESTVKSIRRSEKKQNRTFAKEDASVYDKSANKTNAERSEHYAENQDRIHQTGRLFDPESDIAAARELPDSGQVRTVEKEVPHGTPEDNFYGLSDEQYPEQAYPRNGFAGERDDGTPDEADGEGTGRDGETQSRGSDGMGSPDEQYPQRSGGSRTQGTDLHLSGHDFNKSTGIPYFYEDTEKNELLRNCLALKDHRLEIATFFAENQDREERGNFVKTYFDNTYVEHILHSGQRVGYRAYDDVLTMWRGAYLSREKEVFMHWRQVADAIYGQLLMDQWLTSDEKEMLSDDSQISLFGTVYRERDNQFNVPQAAIDYVLCHGSGISEGKMRIFEQFQKQNGTDENITFLKNEYGTGGHSDAIPGTGLWEEHDAKGIRIRELRPSDNTQIDVLIGWNKVAKRIDELIQADRYLSPAEKEQYPRYLSEQQARERRAEIAEKIRSVVRDFNDFEEQLGNKEIQINLYTLSDYIRSFTFGEKVIRGYNGKPDTFVLPVLRDAMNKIIAEETHLTERCQDILNDLNGDAYRQLEPTYDELNPPPEPPKEYRFSLGDIVYIGMQEYDILSLGENEVTLYDSDFPLLNLVMTREEFDRKISENPMNDKYLHVISETETEKNDTDAQIESLTDEELDELPVSVVENGKVVTYPNADTLLNKVQVSEEEPVAAPQFRHSHKELPHIILPEIASQFRTNFKIENDDIGEGTPLERFHHNIMAIQLLKKLEDEHRLADTNEQRILADYVGWGGLSEFFKEDNPHYLELRVVLTEEEYAAARESSLTAFYTPPVVIKAVYQALENMNFRNGNILEPSCGIGNFMGLLPDSMQNSQFYGIELDPISGRIAQQLYQKNSIAVQGFEKTELPDSFYDCVIGNVPFGDYKITDKRYDKHNFLIHDYFFARTIDKVRPGGIIAFITSKGTLDKENPAVRKYIAQRCDLLGAIRLPNNTFQKAAGTEVTSDIIFLQKRDRLIDIEPDWVHLNKDENGITVNQYFVDNPDMILGEMQMVSGQFGPTSACVPYDDQELSDLLDAAVQNIHGEISEVLLDEQEEAQEDRSIPADPSVRNFSFTVIDGKVYYRIDSRMMPAEVSATAENRIKGLIGIRDSVRRLIELQTENYTDEEIKAEQQTLNRLYDTFQSKYGRIGSRANVSAFDADSSFYLLTSLEVTDDEGVFLRKADIFTKRTIKQKVVVTSVDTASEALALSLAEKTKIDIPYMESLTGKTEQELYADLKGVIFLNPLHTSETDGRPKYLPADEYLSGNVREKLALARKSAELYPEDYGPNVTALEAVQPKDLSASEISVRLGATWLPPEVVSQFMFELFSTPRYMSWNIKVHFSSYTGEWNIEGKSYDRGNVKANNTYGTSRINGYKIIEETLNLRDVRIFDYPEDADGKKHPVLNKKETAIAQGKQELIKTAFEEWIWKDPARREKLCRLYNEKFNSNRPREYDGSHLNFVGINPEISLRKHQVNAIAHIIYGGNTLLAHEVGAGKTFEMVAAAQESKRLGLCNKSLFVVPNHLITQWSSEYLQLYPSANILVATKKDFETKNRKKFCGRIATGDYDAVIIGHSQFEKIPMSIEQQRAILQQQMDEIMDGIIEMKANRGDKFSIKQIEKTKKTIAAKLEKLNDQSRKDDVVTFEELGIDRLFIDEAHYYKNLAAFSKMRNVGGIAQTEAQKSSDLYMKCRYLDEITGGKGVVFATGTPISNSMVEMYTMQKYLQYAALKRNDLIHFDAWASTFGQTVTAIELSPEGTGYRAKTRFAKFYNLPELMTMFKEIADIQTADMLKLPVPEAHFHNVVLKPSEQQKKMVESLSERAERVRNKMVDSSVDNMLLITNDGRKLALDQRLINDMLPDDENSKVSACAANVFEIWQRTTDDKSAQLVFCDLSTPHNDGNFNVYDDLRKKLTEKGIPKEEIVFIHEANSEAQKKELFGKVRNGLVRVLIGSTSKMGAGTNVQKRLVALHHLDTPWRPADLAQRNGRIVRQGNENREVDIYTYVTENTFDSYLYQLVENKQKFIGQIMTSKSPVRSAEDVDEQALSYAEIKMLATGNPYIKEKMDLDIEVSRLKLLKSNYLSQKYSLEDQIIKEFPQKIRYLEQRIEGLKTDITSLPLNTKPNDDGFSPMVINGTIYTEKKAAGSALLEACKAMTSPDPVVIGEYRGFDMELSFDTFSKEFHVSLNGSVSHNTALGTDIYGNIQRLDNTLASMPDRLKSFEEQLENVKTQLENAKAEVDKPFVHEEELQKKTERLSELNAMLDLDKPDNDIVDGDREEKAEAPERKELHREAI